jgi:GNAT superfamily N-acetyltransferase
MDARRIARQAAYNLRTFGVGSALSDIAYRTTNKIVPISILKGMTAELAHVAPDVPDAGSIVTRVVAPDELSRTAALPDWHEGLRPSLVDTALAKGDECVGCFDGDRLVSVGWYARTPTSISDTMTLHFDPTWVYMHRGYTLPAYRGRRLHAVAMSWALRTYTSRGARGLISYVDFNNFPSLRSVERMGYRIFGEVVVVALVGREFALSTAGCRPYGFRVLPSVA